MTEFLGVLTGYSNNAIPVLPAPTLKITLQIFRLMSHE